MPEDLVDVPDDSPPYSEAYEWETVGLDGVDDVLARFIKGGAPVQLVIKSAIDSTVRTVVAAIIERLERECESGDDGSDLNSHGLRVAVEICRDGSWSEYVK